MKAFRFLIFLVIVFGSLIILKDKPYATLNNNDSTLNYEYLYDNTVRFHFIANSDSYFDQMVKNRIKDEVLAYLKKNKNINHGKSQGLRILKENSEKIREICEDVLQEFDLNQDIKIEITEKYFDERIYGKYTVPSGVYDALIVHIGQGNGKNFWSILFSSIGFIDSDDSRKIDSIADIVRGSKINLQQVSSMISSKANKITISFKIIEIFKDFFDRIF